MGKELERISPREIVKEVLRANKAKKDKIKTIDLEMTSRFWASDISKKKKKTGNL